ncbi:hypothetical protein Hanom_Chr14g01300151 [Helianthus anomalus]
MELTSRMKMARFQTFWIQMQKNKPLDENRKTSQTSGTKMAFYSIKQHKCLNFTLEHDYMYLAKCHKAWLISNRWHLIADHMGNG